MSPSDRRNGPDGSESALSSRPEVRDWRESLLSSFILLGTATVLITEGLGAFRALDRSRVAIAWGILTLITLGWVLNRWRTHRNPLKMGLRVRGSAALWLGTVCVYGLIILLVALVAPPNSIDSIQYHMSRVAHWAQQGSLRNFATPIERQLYMPPFAEMAILNLYLLAGGDWLANLVQWSSWVVCLVGVSLIAARLGARTEGQAMAVLFAATLPMGILQASGTQNDVVTALWVVCLAWFAVKAHSKPLSWSDWILVGLATGLGALTKGTYAAFALPFLIWLGISTLRLAGLRRATMSAILGLALGVSLNAGAWARNLRTFDTILGPRWAIAAHANEFLSWKVVASNLLRGVTLNLATPYSIVNGPMREAVVAVHDWIGIDVSDPRTSYQPYRIQRAINEEYAGYPYHYLLIPVCLLLLLWRPASRAKDAGRTTADEVLASHSIAYTAAALSTYLVFCTIYKWQLTGNRLHLPFYVACAPIAGLALQRVRLLPIRPRLRTAAPLLISLLLIATSIRPLLINPSRPAIPRAPDGISLWNTPREEMLFIDAPEVMPAYLPLIDAARQSGCASFGLAITTPYPEYPFWVLLAPLGSGVQLQHIDIRAPLPESARDPDLCAVICTHCSEISPEGLELTFSTHGGYNLYRVPTPIP